MTTTALVFMHLVKNEAGNTADIAKSADVTKATARRHLNYMSKLGMCFKQVEVECWRPYTDVIGSGRRGKNGKLQDALWVYNGNWGHELTLDQVEGYLAQIKNGSHYWCNEAGTCLPVGAGPDWEARSQYLQNVKL
jgi:hypothetical protein